MKRKGWPLALLAAACIATAGCETWDFSLVPATLQGPTYQQQEQLKDKAPLNPGTCPTPEEVERQEKEFFKLQLVEDKRERYWI